ncbi:hypothetical protein, partial [Ruminococcus sp.]|uniref:hypothetical protein n=1 Tax=Ruminococcus sp. TaxID=41978 RepID=UPI0025E339AC
FIRGHNMQEMPDRNAEWTELKFPEGKSYLKKDAPKAVRQEAVEWEKEFYNKTGRRRIVNIDIETALK